MAEALSDGDAKAIARAVVAKARKGNLAAAKLVLDRLWPIPKGRSVAFELPATTDTKGIMEAHSAVIRSLARGSLTPDEADAVSRILTAHLRMIDATEIEARLEALEQQQARESAP